MAVWLLDDEDRRSSLINEGRMLQAAFYTNYAMNAPKELSSASRKYDARLSLSPGGFSADVSQAIQDAREQLREVGRA